MRVFLIVCILGLIQAKPKILNPTKRQESLEMKIETLNHKIISFPKKPDLLQ